MKCLILAAGKGSRLQHKSSSKPLIKLLGVALIERVIRSAIDAGADDFYIVIGNNSDLLSSFLSSLSKRLNISIKIIYNEFWDIYENGYSVLKAKNFLEEPFLLLMGDHLVDSQIIKNVVSSPIKENEIVLGVDIRLKNEFIDFDDVTKVRFEKGKIIDIGKNISNFNGYDTGVFYCSKEIFKALEQAKQDGNLTLSYAVKLLAKKDLAKIKEINSGFWFDIDTEEALINAENFLLNQLRSKKNDGFISYYLNRPISSKITKIISKYNITPNQISLISFIFSCFSAYLFTFSSYFYLLLGGILAQFASIIDGCDGEIARLKYMKSDFGAWFDAVLDRYADAFLLFGLIIHGLINKFSYNYIFWGFFSIIGSFMVSYTADKYDSIIKNFIDKKEIRIGRDLRIFIIFIGCIFNQVLLTLSVIAIIMNIETVRRIWICKKNEKF